MENIKKNLRSVLLSKVGGVPLKQVEQDYKKLVGEKLNWREHGYGSFEAFLNDIPDVVKVAIKKDVLYAFGVAENMSYINPTARKAQYRDSYAAPQNGTSSGNVNMTVYIGNLPANVTKETMKSYLKEYPVKEIRMATHQTSISAWVVTSKEVGQRICSELNRQRYGDKVLKVEPARNQNSGGKPDVPTKLSAGDSSGHSSAASVSSDGESLSQKNPSTKNNNVVNSLNSVDVLNKPNDVGELLHHRFAVEPGQQRRSQSDVEKSKPAFALESAANEIQPSKLLGFKESMVFSEARFDNGADFRKDNSEFPCSGEPPPLVENDDWEIEFEDRGGPSKCFSSQRGCLKQTTDEPPPPTSRDETEKVQRKKESSSSTSWPANAALQTEQPNLNPWGDTYNLYVKNIPVGTKTAELRQLFTNSVKIVPLSIQSCFAVFNTFREVEDASRRYWSIHGVPIFVDVASRHKSLMSEPEGHVQPTRNGGQDEILDICSGFENLTCTVGCNNERTVMLHGEKLPPVEKSYVSRPHSTSTSKEQENFQQRSFPTSEMPPLVSRTDHGSSQVSLQPPTNREIPPLLSTEEIAKIREHRPPLSQKALRLAELCNSEAVRDDFAPLAQNDVNSKQSFGLLNSQANLQGPVQNAQPSKQLKNVDKDFQTSNQKMHEKFKAQTAPSMQQSDSLKNQNSLQMSGQEVVPMLQHDHLNSLGHFQSAANEVATLDSHGCAALLSSPSSAVTASLQSSALVPLPLRPIPDEMRLKELQRMIVDAFPGDNLPTHHMMPDTIDVVIICVVPGFENSFFWGQVASEPFESDLQKMYDLIPKMEEISGRLKLASASLRRGAAKYGEDWCRVWIKQRGETASTVFFIDFGNFETISNNDIYELPEEFWRVRPTALPFRVLDAGKMKLSDYINHRVTAKVNKKSQRGRVCEIYDLHAQS